MRIQASLLLLSLSTFCAARAADVVVQRSVGRDCYLSTLVERSAANSDGAAAACDAAISAFIHDPHALAAALANRAEIRIKLGRFADAIADADRAIAADSGLAAAFTNRGAALVGLERYQEAIESLNRAIALGGDRMELAYYDRGLANDHLGNVRNAYLDYRKSSELNPAFAPPKEQLPRFRVAYKASGQAD